MDCQEIYEYHPTSKAKQNGKGILESNGINSIKKNCLEKISIHSQRKSKTVELTEITIKQNELRQIILSEILFVKGNTYCG